MARRTQWLVVAAALLLWAGWPEPAFWTLPAAYGLAWLLVSLVGPSVAKLSLPRPLAWATLLLVVLVPVATAYRFGDAWAKEEDLRGLLPHLLNHARLEAEPSLFPPVLFHDRPQTFYGYASEASALDLRLGREGPLIAGVSLGDGLFRFEIRPERDGAGMSEARRLAVELVADGRPHARELLQVHPLAHLRRFDSAPSLGLAASASEETDEVFVFSRAGLERTLEVGDGPTHAVFVPGTSLLAVTHRYEPELWLLPAAVDGAMDGGQEQVPERLVLGAFQRSLAAAPGGERLAVALAGEAPRIELVRTEPLERLETIELEFRPDWILFGRSAGELLISCRETQTLHRYLRREGGQWEASEIRRLGRPVTAMARSADGSLIYAAATDYRPDGAPRTANHFIQDQILVVDLERWEVADRILTARRSRRQRNAGNVDSGCGPAGMAALEDGSLLVAFSGSEEVWSLPRGEHHPSRVTRDRDLDLIAPQGVADLGDGYWAASSPAGGAVAVFAPDGEMVDFVGVAPPDDDLLSAPADSTRRHALKLRAGERAFTEATRSGISCASCHIDGDTDHSAHNIGQRPLLPTLTIRGIAGTTPYLRDGSFPRVRDLDTHLARTLYRGYRRRDSHRGEVLEAYVESVPRSINPRSLGSRDLERERAGRKAFGRAGCELCHALPAFTNLGGHPVRALFPDYGADQRKTSMLDTPSLLGTHERSHFLQDGRAHDLEAVFTDFNESNRHGATAILSDGERAALAYFLESL